MQSSLPYLLRFLSIPPILFLPGVGFMWDSPRASESVGTYILTGATVASVPVVVLQNNIITKTWLAVWYTSMYILFKN